MIFDTIRAYHRKTAACERLDLNRWRQVIGNFQKESQDENGVRLLDVWERAAFISEYVTNRVLIIFQKSDMGQNQTKKDNEGDQVEHERLGMVKL